MDEKEKDINFKDLFTPLTTKKAIIFIVLIGFFVFSNSLFNNFVWDDKTYIISNAHVHSINLLDSLKESLFNTGGQYRPLPVLYFSLLYTLFGETSFYYHVIQLIFHIVNTILIFFIFKTFFKKNLSLLLSIIFLIHPIQVESVSYIAASASPLFTLFGLSALLLSLKQRINLKRLVGISILLLLSLLTKEAGFLFLVIILCYWFLYKKLHILKLFISSAIVVIVYFALRFGIGNVYFTKLPLVPIARLPLIDRLLNIPSIVFYYIKTLFFPNKLAIGQQRVITKFTFSTFFGPLVIDILITLLIGCFGFYVYKTNKNLLLFSSFS